MSIYLKQVYINSGRFGALMMGASLTGLLISAITSEWVGVLAGTLFLGAVYVLKGHGSVRIFGEMPLPASLVWTAVFAFYSAVKVAPNNQYIVFGVLGFLVISVLFAFRKAVLSPV